MLPPTRKHKPRQRFLPIKALSALMMAVLLLLSGCGEAIETVQETDTRAYRRGKSLQREGRVQEALLAFLQVIDERKDAPESHLEAGLIHLNHLRDPLSAIYHFNRYLQFRGDGEQAETVRDLIVTAQKEFLRRLPGEPFADQVERMDLSARLDTIQRENENLRSEIVSLRRQLETSQSRVRQLEDSIRAAQQRATGSDQVAPIVVAPPPDPAQPQSRPTTYTVQPGDTLSSISRTVYGTTGRWQEIYQANRDVLPSPNSLRVGQQLRIP